MTKLILKIITYFFVLTVLSLFPFLHISSVPGILLLALTLAITNTLLRPILVLIALPFNLITFGIASIFANLLTLIIANAICGTILLHGFWLMFLVATVMMFTDDLIRFIRTNRYKKHAANVS